LLTLESTVLPGLVILNDRKGSESVGKAFAAMPKKTHRILREKKFNINCRKTKTFFFITCQDFQHFDRRNEL